MLELFRICCATLVKLDFDSSWCGFFESDMHLFETSAEYYPA